MGGAGRGRVRIHCKILFLILRFVFMKAKLLPGFIIINQKVALELKPIKRQNLTSQHTPQRRGGVRVGPGPRGDVRAPARAQRQPPVLQGDRTK
jgi:hypothetical protein